MQIKKEVLLFCLLVVLSISLLIAADHSTNTITDATNPEKCSQCCNGNSTEKVESPWNFITSGLLHFSVYIFN